MKKCGQDNKPKFKNSEQQPKSNQKHRKKRNVIWYNPPFSNSLKTNVGRKLIKLVKKHSINNIP